MKDRLYAYDFLKSEQVGNKNQISTKSGINKSK